MVTIWWNTPTKTLETIERKSEPSTEQLETTDAVWRTSIQHASRCQAGRQLIFHRTGGSYHEVEGVLIDQWSRTCRMHCGSLWYIQSKIILVPCWDNVGVLQALNDGLLVLCSTSHVFFKAGRSRGYVLYFYPHTQERHHMNLWCGISWYLQLQESRGFFWFRPGEFHLLNVQIKVGSSSVSGDSLGYQGSSQIGWPRPKNDRFLMGRATGYPNDLRLAKSGEPRGLAKISESPECGCFFWLVTATW